MDSVYTVQRSNTLDAGRTKESPKKDRMREIYAMEAEYLCGHPNSGYLTEILPLKAFHDYIDYLPQGCVVRKIGVMVVVNQFANKNFISANNI